MEQGKKGQNTGHILCYAFNVDIGAAKEEGGGPPGRDATAETGQGPAALSRFYFQVRCENAAHLLTQNVPAPAQARADCLKFWILGTITNRERTEGGGRMAKKGNLKPMNERTPEEVRRISAEAGRKSGAARRRNREFKKCCEYVMGLKPRAAKKQLREWERNGFDFSEGDPPTLGERIALSLALRAEGGDDNALRLFMSYGHNPTMAEAIEREKIEAISKAKAPVNVNVNGGGGEVVDSIRAWMEREACDERPGDGAGVSDATPGEIREPAGVREADGASQPLDP